MILNQIKKDISINNKLDLLIKENFSCAILATIFNNVGGILFLDFFNFPVDLALLFIFLLL